MTVAVVDDEKNIRMTVSTALKKEGFIVIEYENGQIAFDARNQKPDLYVLDIMMPVMDGITLLRALRENQNKTPVIFLTSKDDEFDKILGLELGADDYLCKPFSMRELIARIKVVLRRAEKSKSEEQNPKSQAELLNCSGIQLNLASYSATVNKNPIELTVTEFRLLKAFIENKNNVLTREQLIEAAYPEDTYLNDRAVDCHIKRLRKKIGSESIETIYGLGYKFNENHAGVN